MRVRAKMRPKKEEKIRKLKQMIQSKDPEEPVEKVLVTFCARTGTSMNTCKKYYKFLVDSEEIKESGQKR